MGRALVLSLVLHACIIGALIWGDRLYLKYLQAQRKDQPAISATLLIDKTYAPTDTAMRQGPSDKNLPPPKIQLPKKIEVPTINTKKKKSTKSILDKIRAESVEEKRPPPKIDNFPTHEKGEKKAMGTGGRGLQTLSPAQQALQSAIRKYYEIEGSDTLRKRFPNARGIFTAKLVGVGNQFEIATLSIVDPSGVALLDRQCELAIRKALHQETFAQDVIAELTGKENPIICQP